MNGDELILFLFFSALFWSGLWPDRGCPWRGSGRCNRSQGAGNASPQSDMRVCLSWVPLSREPSQSEKENCRCFIDRLPSRLVLGNPPFSGLLFIFVFVFSMCLGEFNVCLTEFMSLYPPLIFLQIILLD